MRMLTIEASSPQSADDLSDALAAFDAEVVDGGKGFPGVRVPLDESQRTSAVLNAIQQYVIERDCGPARIDLDGDCYMLHAD
jgi:hypothetical protein